MSRALKYANKLYEGTIQAKDMKRFQPYKGNVDSRDMTIGRLYEGSIKQDAYRQKIYGSMPGREKPYRYYKLRPDYYDWPKKRNMTNHPTTTSPRQRQHSPTFAQGQRPLEERRAFTANNKHQPIYATARSEERTIVQPFSHKQENPKTENKIENKPKEEKEQIRPPKTATATTFAEPTNQPPKPKESQEPRPTTKRQQAKQLQDTKPANTLQQEHKPKPIELPAPKSSYNERSDNRSTVKDKGAVTNQRQEYNRVSPFPPPSPEPTIPERKWTVPPDAMRHQNGYTTRPEPVFPPIIPVSARDYSTTRPAVPVIAPRQFKNNALIPVDVPSLKTQRYNLIRRNQVSPFLYDDDGIRDSLRRSFPTVPGYNAVGSILRSLEVYGD